MRISTFWMQQTSVNAMLDQQAALARTQQQVSTGRRILSPSDDPAGSARVLDLGHADAAISQYQRNIDAADARLGTEDQALSSVSGLLGRVRTLALEGANGSTGADARKDIAIEIRERIKQLVQLANSRDAGGEYLFAGNSTRTQPFVQTGNTVSYAGDQGQRSIAIAPGQTLATGDPGSDVFQNIPDGNGTFSIAAAPANTGTTVSGATSVTDIAAWDHGTYQIRFTTPGSYDVLDAANAVVSSGAYASGDTIAFRGVQVAFSGAPAAGDSYAVAPSVGKDVFSTLGDIASALEAPNFNAHDASMLTERIGRAVENLDQAVNRIIEVRTRVGARLNIADDQQSVNANIGLDLKTALAKVRDVDPASAISQLNLQMTSLQAAQAAYVKTQSLSLFNYLK